MIPPKPYSLSCPKCSYSKTVRPKSDVLDPREMMQKCPKCETRLERSTKAPSLLDKLFGRRV